MRVNRAIRALARMHIEYRRDSSVFAEHRWTSADAQEAYDPAAY